MLIESQCQKQMWAEAANTAVYLFNRSPTKKVWEERWSGRKVDLKLLKVFGCLAYAHIADPKRQKLDDKSRKYMFVGYSETAVGYRLMDPETHRLHLARDVVFLEESFYEKTGTSEAIDLSRLFQGENYWEDGLEDNGSVISETAIIQLEQLTVDNTVYHSEESLEEVMNNAEEDTSISAVDTNEEQIIGSISGCVGNRYPKRNVRKPNIHDDFVMKYSDSNFATLWWRTATYF